jgi:hypothetical protein
VWCGKRIVKYPSAPVGGVWPSPSFNAPLNFSATPPPASRDRPVSFAVSGAQIAVGYQVDPAANSSYLRMYSSQTGAALSVYRSADFPAAYGERGWLDMPRAVTFVNDWVWMEDDQLSKQVGVRV